VFVLKNYCFSQHRHRREDITIADFARLVAAVVVGFKSQLAFDRTRTGRSEKEELAQAAACDPRIR
jgi:hypothetical protein